MTAPAEAPVDLAASRKAGATSRQKSSHFHAITRVKSTHVCRLAQAQVPIEDAGENFRRKDANFGGSIPETGKSPCSTGHALLSLSVGLNTEN